MNATDRRRLRINYVEIVKNLDPQDITDVLYQERVLSESDCECIQSGTTRAQRTRMLLAILPKKNPSGYAKLVVALKSAGYVTLAENLENTDETQLDDLSSRDSSLGACTGGIILDLKLYELKEKLEQQTAIVNVMQQEVRQLQLELRRHSKSFEQNLKYKQTVNTLEDLQEEDQKGVLNNMYTKLYSEVNWQNDRSALSIIAVRRLACHPRRKCSYRSQDLAGEHGRHVTIKCVIVGDGVVGKTTLGHYFHEPHPTSYTSTVLDNHAVDVLVGETLVTVNFSDTSGQKDSSKLRALSYAGSHVGLLVFSCTSQSSLTNIVVKWQHELRHFCPKVPYILIGSISPPCCESSSEIKNNCFIDQSEADQVAKFIGSVDGKAHLIFVESADCLHKLMILTAHTGLSYLCRKRKKTKSCSCM